MSRSTRRATHSPLAPAIAVLAILAACGQADPAEPGAGGETEAAEVSVADVRDDVLYYDPCGNTPFALDGRTWYPIDADGVESRGLEDHPEPDDDASEGADAAGRGGAAGAVGPSGFAAVVPMVPAPVDGDETGEWVEWSDGTARFTSDNGDVSWLTLEEREYDWVC